MSKYDEQASHTPEAWNHRRNCSSSSRQESPEVLAWACVPEASNRGNAKGNLASILDEKGMLCI